MLYAQYTATHSRPDYSTQHIHCTHIDMCVRARNRICPYEREWSLVRSLARLYGQAHDTPYTVRCYIITPSTSSSQQFACIRCPCATQKSTECSIGISSIKIIIFFNFSLCGRFAAKFRFVRFIRSVVGVPRSTRSCIHSIR